jgi:hypothetical protein
MVTRVPLIAPLPALFGLFYKENHFQKKEKDRITLLCKASLQ